MRRKKDRVKIVDFGPIDESSTKNTLFTYEELQNYIDETPEFRFIAEEIGIQPKPPTHVCVPQEISEFLQSGDNVSLLDAIRRVCFSNLLEKYTCKIFFVLWQIDIVFLFLFLQEVESQRKEHEKENADGLESTWCIYNDNKQFFLHMNSRL